MEDKRAVCLNCIDGRAQLPVINWILDSYDVDCVDMITEPGMDGVISRNHETFEVLAKKVELSVRVNNASVIFVAAHHDCRGNPASEEEHCEHVRKAVERVRQEFPRMPIVGVWVDHDWKAQEVVVDTPCYKEG